MSRRYPGAYDPSTDAGLALWLDPRDSTSASLLDTGGGAIANGATIGTYKSKKGTARSFTQWGSNARPTWDSTGINGHPAVRCNAQILTTRTTMSDFASMTGLTIIQVIKRNGSTGGESAALGFTMLDQSTGKNDISMVQVRASANYFMGGRRARGDSFASVIGSANAAAYITTAVFDYSNALAYLYGNGVRDVIGASYQTAGSTNAADPYAISVGGFAQETGSAASIGADCWAGETLVYLSVLTADQLVARHAYVRAGWGI